MLKKIIDIKLLKYLMFYYAIVSLVGGLKYSIFKSKGLLENFSFKDIWIYNSLFDWISVLIYMVFINWVVKLFIKKKANKTLVFLFHFIFSLLLGFFIFIVAGFIVAIMIDDLSHVARNVTLNHYMRNIDLNFLVYFSMLSIIYAYYYITRIKELENQSIKLHSQLINTKMNVLKAQLHPHFVFNTLNSISSLIEIDKEKSQDLIADFGDLFREIIEYKDDNLIPLHKEISFLNKYIDIISVRFSDHLTITKNIEKGLNNVLIPNMLLQPLLENAIKYGYSYHHTNLNIKLHIFKKQKYLHIILENDGESLKFNFKALLKNGIGLKNTQERLNTLFKDNYEFTLKNKKDKNGVKVIIKIPLKKQIIDLPSQE